MKGVFLYVNADKQTSMTYDKHDSRMNRSKKTPWKDHNRRAYWKEVRRQKNKLLDEFDFNEFAKYMNIGTKAPMMYFVHVWCDIFKYDSTFFSRDSSGRFAKPGATRLVHSC